MMEGVQEEPAVHLMGEAPSQGEQGQQATGPSATPSSASQDAIPTVRSPSGSRGYDATGLRRVPAASGLLRTRSCDPGMMVMPGVDYSKGGTLSEMCGPAHIAGAMTRGVISTRSPWKDGNRRLSDEAKRGTGAGAGKSSPPLPSLGSPGVEGAPEDRRRASASLATTRSVDKGSKVWADSYGRGAKGAGGVRGVAKSYSGVKGDGALGP